jgi:hypothetical protein
VRRAFDLPKLLVKLQEYLLRQLFGAFPIAQKAQREAEDERLVVCQDLFKIQAGETDCHTRITDEQSSRLQPLGNLAV